MAWTCCTPLSWSRTAELFPPQCASTPGCDGSICQNRSKCLDWWLESAAHPWAQSSNCRTVTAIALITPGNDRSICQNRSKGRNLWLESAAHPWAGLWTAELSPPQVFITPGNDCVISLTPQCKGTLCRCQLWLKYQSVKALSVLYLCFFYKVYKSDALSTKRSVGPLSSNLEQWKKGGSAEKFLMRIRQGDTYLNHLSLRHQPPSFWLVGVLRSWHPPVLTALQNISPEISTAYFEPKPSWMLLPAPTLTAIYDEMLIFLRTM